MLDKLFSKLYMYLLNYFKKKLKKNSLFPVCYVYLLNQTCELACTQFVETSKPNKAQEIRGWSRETPNKQSSHLINFTGCFLYNFPWALSEGAVERDP